MGRATTWMVALLLAAVPGTLAPAAEVRSDSYPQILATRTTELVVHQVASNPLVHVFDIPTLTQQGEMFNRIVALIEQINAPRDRVLSDTELAAHIQSVGRTSATFSFGNDFRTSELVKFFNLADFSGVTLNPDEERLRAYLLDAGLAMTRWGSLTVRFPDQVILSVPQRQMHALPGGGGLEVSQAARETVLRHELSHAEYYTNRPYADFCRRFWAKAMTDAERAAFRKFLGSHSYDARNEELMINETQAYLMHTPDPGSFSAQKVGLPQATIESLRARFLAGNPPTRLFDEARAAP
jgi:hypothetical protein